MKTVRLPQQLGDGWNKKTNCVPIKVMETCGRQSM